MVPLPLGGRLFVSSIITQIGRENKFSVKIRVSRTVEDAGPYKERSNFLMRTVEDAGPYKERSNFLMRTVEDAGPYNL